MKILFFGCQKIAVDILKLIQESTHDVVGVVTQDEERDRLFGDELVSEYCFRNGIPSFRAHEGSLSDCFDLFNSLSPDIIFSIYYRRILPNKIIGLSKLGVLICTLVFYHEIEDQIQHIGTSGEGIELREQHCTI